MTTDMLYLARKLFATQVDFDAWLTKPAPVLDKEKKDLEKLYIQKSKHIVKKGKI